MILSVHDRLMILSLLPKEGNFTNLKLIRKAREALSFDEAEHLALNVREVEEGAERRMIWDNAVPDKDISLGEVVTQIIVKELKTLDEKGKLTADHMNIYEKFIEKLDAALDGFVTTLLDVCEMLKGARLINQEV